MRAVDKEHAFIKCNEKHVDLISFTSALWEDFRFNFTAEYMYAYEDTMVKPLTIKEKAKL